MLKYQYSACKIIFFFIFLQFTFFPYIIFKETWFCPQQLIYIEQYSKEETPITYVVITGAEPLRARGGASIEDFCHTIRWPARHIFTNI